MCGGKFVTWIFCYLILQRIQFYANGEYQSKLLDLKESKYENCLDKKLFTNCIESSVNNNIYDYSSYDIEDDKKENLISLSKYRGNYIRFCQGFLLMFN
jgi:hypothetical protein